MSKEQKELLTVISYIITFITVVLFGYKIGEMIYPEGIGYTFPLLLSMTFGAILNIIVMYISLGKSKI